MKCWRSSPPAPRTRAPAHSTGPAPGRPSTPRCTFGRGGAERADPPAQSRNCEDRAPARPLPKLPAPRTMPVRRLDTARSDQPKVAGSSSRSTRTPTDRRSPKRHRDRPPGARPFGSCHASGVLPGLLSSSKGIASNSMISLTITNVIAGLGEWISDPEPAGPDALPGPARFTERPSPPLCAIRFGRTTARPVAHTSSRDHRPPCPRRRSRMTY